MSQFFVPDLGPNHWGGDRRSGKLDSGQQK